MHPATALLLALFDDPRDPPARAAFADWLVEQDTADHLRRAALLRLQSDWLREKRQSARARLEIQALRLVAEDEALIGPLARLLPDLQPLLGLDLPLVLFLSAPVVPAVPDRLDERSVWRGVLCQTSSRFATALNVHHRAGNAFRGDMEQDFLPVFGTRTLGRFAVRGVALCGQKVAFVTDEISGPVLVPGLYLADLDGDTLAGTWQVAPSSGTVELQRRRNRRPA